MGDSYSIINVVKEVLTKRPDTRSSDSELAFFVYKNLAAKKGININDITVGNFFLMMPEYGFPSPETISRARRKVQEECPLLRGSKEAKEARKQKAEEYRKSYSNRKWLFDNLLPRKEGDLNGSSQMDKDNH